MTCEEYREWAVTHIDAFGFQDHNAKCLLAWESAFAKQFTAAELHDATNDLLGRSDVKPFASDQRPQIIASIVATRRRRESQSKTQTLDHRPARCDLCRGSGFAIVPHPMKDEHGNLNLQLKYPHEDPYGRDLSVCCECDKGQRNHAGYLATSRSCLTFGEYRSRYPDWADVLDARDAIRRAEFEGAIKDCDWEKVKRDLAERTRIPRRTG